MPRDLFQYPLRNIRRTQTPFVDITGIPQYKSIDSPRAVSKAERLPPRRRRHIFRFVIHFELVARIKTAHLNDCFLRLFRIVTQFLLSQTVALPMPLRTIIHRHLRLTPRRIFRFRPGPVVFPDCPLNQHGSHPLGISGIPQLFQFMQI